MTKILGISGSLRRGSFNTGLLRMAAVVAPEGTEVTVRTLHNIPLYDGDVEASDGIPQAAADLKKEIQSADGLILASPEYNNSLPGVFKNGIDWMSRPPADISKVFGGKPVAIMGATPGNFGTLMAQTAWLPVLRALGMKPWFGPRLMVSRAPASFDQQGTLNDEAVKASLQKFIQGFVDFIRQGG